MFYGINTFIFSYAASENTSAGRWRQHLVRECGQPGRHAYLRSMTHVILDFGLWIRTGSNSFWNGEVELEVKMPPSKSIEVCYCKELQEMCSCQIDAIKQRTMDKAVEERYLIDFMVEVEEEMLPRFRQGYTEVDDSRCSDCGKRSSYGQ